MAVRVYLGVGSNLNRENALRFAKAELEKLFTANYQVSSVWASNAVRAAEPGYYNMVVGGDVEMSLDDLFKAIAAIEDAAGSEPMIYNGTNFGVKRRLDVDILVYGETVTTKPCKLPRHDIQDYPFVLCPLCELDPDLVHPLLKLKAGDIWKEMEPRLPERMKISRVNLDLEVKANFNN